MTYTQHPLSAAFPAMADADYQSLKDSIEASGVLNPITIYEGQVIDGWHRYRAANELSMECPEQVLEAWIDPKDFVLAQNKNRRHITAAQLAMATTAVYAWAPVGFNQHTQAGGAGTAHPPKTNKELAELSGVSERTIKQAKVVQEKAAPEVKEAVRQGKVGLEKAVAIAKAPVEQQKEAISKPLPKKSQVADFKAKQAEARERSEVEEFRIVNESLQEQVYELRETLALNDLPEFERIDAKELLDRQRTEIASLKEELATVKSQRDQYMAANDDLQRQIKRLNRA